MRFMMMVIPKGFESAAPEPEIYLVCSLSWR
jgi:hypothetical protein